MAPWPRSATPSPDEIVKNSFANFAFENYEIAAYTSLQALADHVGATDDLSHLQRNLDEEIAMANWLQQNIEAVTLQYATLRESGETAKK